jgi:hypothetical protein
MIIIPRVIDERLTFQRRKIPSSNNETLPESLVFETDLE